MEVSHVTVYAKDCPLIPIARGMFPDRLIVGNCREDVDRVIKCNVGQVVLIGVKEIELHEELRAALAVAQGTEELVLIEV